MFPYSLCTRSTVRLYIGKQSPDNPGHSDHYPFVLSLLQLQGAIALASITQLFIGFSGVCGMLTRFIGPITVAATISLIGISLFPVAGSMCATHWPIAGLLVNSILIFTLRNVFQQSVTSSVICDVYGNSMWPLRLPILRTLETTNQGT